jgi:hypothetical protein
VPLSSDGRRVGQAADALLEEAVVDVDGDDADDCAQLPDSERSSAGPVEPSREPIQYARPGVGSPVEHVPYTRSTNSASST